MRAEVERQWKSTAHIVEALDETVGDLALEEGLVGPNRAPHARAAGASVARSKTSRGSGAVTVRM